MPGLNLKADRMKKNAGLYLFVISLFADLAGVYFKNEMLVYAAKPLVVITLIIYFLAATSGFKSNLIRLVFASLAFSWLGDVLLMFEPMNGNFFIFGLVAFLIAHLFYILFFLNIRRIEMVSLKTGLIILVIAYYTGLIFLLYNYLGEMKIPVMMYGIVISIMFLLAIHMLFIKNKKAGRLMMLGALLFISSDSILAINKFYDPFESTGIFTMLTYGFAQLFITLGAERYITSTSKQ